MIQTPGLTERGRPGGHGRPVMVSKGVGLFPTEPVEQIRENVRLAEELGYEHAWIGDSQNIWRESSVTMGAAAVGTSRIVLGTGVTNAVTRHRSLLASTWATLHELTEGRAALGIGTGDSSLRTMGLSPLKLAELERGALCAVGLERGEVVLRVEAAVLCWWVSCVVDRFVGCTDCIFILILMF